MKLNLDTIVARVQKNKQKKRELKEWIAILDNFIKSLTLSYQEQNKFLQNLLLMSQEQVDVIEVLHQKMNVVEEWIKYWVRQVEELITYAIRKYKEVYHLFAKSKKFGGECIFHHEQVDVERKNIEAHIQMDVQELIREKIILKQEVPVCEKWKKQLSWEGDTLVQCIKGFEKVTNMYNKLIDKDKDFIKVLAQQDCDPQTLGQEGKEVKDFKEWIQRINKDPSQSLNWEVIDEIIHCRNTMVNYEIEKMQRNANILKILEEYIKLKNSWC